MLYIDPAFPCEALDVDTTRAEMPGMQSTVVYSCPQDTVIYSLPQDHVVYSIPQDTVIYSCPVLSGNPSTAALDREPATAAMYFPETSSTDEPMPHDDNLITFWFRESSD